MDWLFITDPRVFCYAIVIMILRFFRLAAATAAGVAVAQDFCSGTSIETYGDDLPSYDFISGQMA